MRKKIRRRLKVLLKLRKKRLEKPKDEKLVPLTEDEFARVWGRCSRSRVTPIGDYGQDDDEEWERW